MLEVRASGPCSTHGAGEWRASIVFLLRNGIRPSPTRSLARRRCSLIAGMYGEHSRTSAVSRGRSSQSSAAIARALLITTEATS
jgi:hypothetical protein